MIQRMSSKRKPIQRQGSVVALLMMLSLLILAPPLPRAETASARPREAGEVDPRAFVPTGPVKMKQRFRDYEVRTYEPDLGDGSFEIRRGGRRVYARVSEGGKFLIGEIFGSETYQVSAPIGKDITGKGIPNLVVSEWTGGGHCCFLFHVFEIGRTFRKIATLDAGHGDLSNFADLDGNGRLVFVTNDWTFAYWETSFAQSPAPRVILRFLNGRYRVAQDLMRKPPPSPTELAAKAREVREGGEWDADGPPPILWGFMLDLIYSGNARQAWGFFEMAWRPAAQGKAAFLSKFRSHLTGSPYWSEIKAMNAE